MGYSQDVVRWARVGVVALSGGAACGIICALDKNDATAQERGRGNEKAMRSDNED